jgi:hypothetical protein
MAPATMGRGSPKPLPTPMRAMPTVPAVVQELPVASETMAQMAQAAGRNTVGLRSFKP